MGVLYNVYVAVGALYNALIARGACSRMHIKKLGVCSRMYKKLGVCALECKVFVSEDPLMFANSYYYSYIPVRRRRDSNPSHVST